MAATNFFELEVPCLSANIALCRMTVASFASQLDFTLSEVEEIKVAVSEAVSNAVLHAYTEETIDESIQLRGEISDDRLLRVVVRDWGRGIEDVELAQKPEYTTAEDRMGLGLVFIDSFMDRFTINSAPGEGTEVVMERSPANLSREDGEVDRSGHENTPST